MLIESKDITEDELEIYGSSKYEVIVVLPFGGNPRMNTYILDQIELGDFMRSDGEYAGFVISVKQVIASA